MVTQAFGSVLRQRRMRAGMTQECLAQRLGIDRSYLSRLECGHGHDLSHHVARRVAAELHLTMEELDSLLYPEERTWRE
jgi:transcriptional regulator with XRE-family HTH domain